MDRIEFEDALQSYENRFNSMQPEMELTIRDPEMGVEGWVVVVPQSPAWLHARCRTRPG